MAIIRTIAVSLVARQEQFTRGMQQSAEATGKLKKELDAAGQSLTKFDQQQNRQLQKMVNTQASQLAKVAVPGLGIAALTQMATRSLAAGEELHRLAQRLGTTAEAMSAMHFAAEKVGIETADFDKTMEKLSKSLGMAQKEGSEQAKVLASMGLSARELARLPLHDVFLKLADAINRMPDPQERLRAMFALFEEAGPKMVDMLRLGSGGMRELMEQAASLGATVSNAQAKAAADAVGGVREMRAALAGLRDDLISQVAPAVGGTARDLSKLVAEANRLTVGTQPDTSFGEKLEEMRKKAVDVIAKLLLSGPLTGRLLGGRDITTTRTDRLTNEFRGRAARLRLDEMLETTPLERRGERRGIPGRLPHERGTFQDQISIRIITDVRDGISRLVRLMERNNAITETAAGAAVLQ